MNHRITAGIGLTFFVLSFGLLSSARAADKIKVVKQEDLPRHSYTIKGKAVDFLTSNAAVDSLALRVKKDLEDDLAKYDIQDKTTLQGYYGILGVIELLGKRYDSYLTYLNKRKELEDKESNRLLMGLMFESYIAAEKAGGDSLLKTFDGELNRRLDALPYDKVGTEIKSNKGQLETFSRELFLGSVDATIQPVLDKSNGELSKDLAGALLNGAMILRFLLPVKDHVVADYERYLNAHNVVKSDIWQGREVTLAAGDPGKPVVTAIWDSGVDTDIFARTNQLWTNSKEKPGNGKDDDKNGFVDDVHGIAWSLHSDKEIPLLFDMGDVSQDRPRFERQMKGLIDLQSNLDSPEAQDVRQTMSQLPRDSVKSFIESLGKYGDYCHGTHVAGIAARGNPFVRILVARETVDYHVIPETPTVELSEKSAKAMQETVDYFKRNGVRVVNMSWGGDLQSIERALEANHAGGDATERKAMALKIFHIERDALFAAIKGAPDILFVAAAGNENSDNAFEEAYPASFDLPNLLTAGAVDQAGEETSFTSFGKTDVYADGFEVTSYVPGGDQLKLSGTSMASPNVVNLAAKLLALRPKLKVAQLRDLIVQGADQKVAGTRTFHLMNPKKSAELLSQLK